MVDRNALARATESTTSPTPGYLYNDISKSAATSPAAASEIATYLIRRLQSKNNVNTKYKCLKVIQMVASHPATRGQFKRVLVQDMSAVAAIKTSLQFRGPPDAVHGDTLYEKVRNQAKETLDAIYSDDPSSEQNHNQSSNGGGGGYGNQSYGGAGAGGGGPSGYGNSSYNSSSYNPSTSSSSGGGAKRMEGIGNPMFADPRLHQKEEMTIGNIVTGVKDGFVGMIKDPLARGIQPSVGAPRPGGMSMSGYGGSSNGWKSAPPGQSQLAQSTNGAWTMASNRGPNAYASDPYKSGGGNVSSGVGGSWGSTTPSVAAHNPHIHTHIHNPNPIVHISGTTGGAKSDGTYEKNLILELCPPGGMKAEPPADKMQSFAQAIPNLNPDLICPALLDALEDGQPWIIRAKALCVMEICINVAQETIQSGAMGNNNNNNNNNPYADFFHACKDEIEPLANHSRNSVREPAKRVLRALGLDIPSPTMTASVKKDAAAVAPVPMPAPASNLLDFDEPVVPSVPADVPPPIPTDAPPAPPAPTPTMSSQSMFGGMNVKGATSTAPVTKTVATPAPMIQSVPAVPVQSIEADIFGNVLSHAETITPAPVPTVGKLFDNMAVKSTPQGTEVTSSGKENVENAATSSGFSFIADNSTEVTKPQSTTSPVKASFDPLLGLGDDSYASNNNKMQQSSQIQGGMMTPQMAAVVQQQQQQILMMQAQMQQMQMGGSARGFMMMPNGQGQMQQPNNNSNSIVGVGGSGSGINPGMGMSMPMRQNIMGASNGSGVATSFAFMEDPNKARREATNKKFDFVADAMKGAK